MNKSKTAVFINILFAAYCAVMLVLLFHRSRFDLGMGYLENLRNSYNIVPFRTVLNYIRMLSSESLLMRRSAFINLAGNILCFVPLGFFLPLSFKRLQRPAPFFGFTAILILSVELIQLFSLRGSFDIDDLIFNLFGAGIGFVFFIVLRFVKTCNCSPNIKTA